MRLCLRLYHMIPYASLVYNPSFRFRVNPVHLFRSFSNGLLSFIPNLRSSIYGEYDERFIAGVWRW